MEYLQIFNKALNKLKSLYDLPLSGFLTGGSLANLIWEEISGVKAEINDIDIFILTDVVDRYDDSTTFNTFKNVKHEKVIFEDYRGLNYRYDSKITYLIEKSTNNGIFNEIEYSSTTSNPQIIIDSFDINCCQVGFDIKEEKFYWTDEFLEFLKTGKLKITDMRSPAHTAIRLAKKMTQLNAKCDEIEFDIIKYTLKHKHIIGLNRFRFKEKYKNDFEKYNSILGEKFSICRDLETEERIKQKYNIDDALYYLEAKVDSKFSPLSVLGISLPKEYMYYMRNIFGNNQLEENWQSINLIIDTKLSVSEYFDCELKQEDLNLLKKFIQVAPKCIQHLKGHTLSKQLVWINNIVTKFEYDPIIAISIIEENPIHEDLDLDDEMNLLLLELGVRKKIVTDSTRKVDYIFNQVINKKTEDIDILH